jgi:hypothetical protein
VRLAILLHDIGWYAFLSDLSLFVPRAMLLHDIGWYAFLSDLSLFVPRPLRP